MAPEDNPVAKTEPALHQIGNALLTDEQCQLLKDTVCSQLNDGQLNLFVVACRQSGLDPFRRQICAVLRYSNREKRQMMTIQVEIGGLRSIAQACGGYLGQTGPEWCGEDGVWKDVWVPKKPPHAARVGVVKAGNTQPTLGIALYRSFYQQKSPLWGTMPEHMLAKCAEAQALRRAFPQRLSGLYTNDEMQQADSITPDAPPNLDALKTPRNWTDEFKDFLEHADAQGVSTEHIERFCSTVHDFLEPGEGWRELGRKQAEDIMRRRDEFLTAVKKYAAKQEGAWDDGIEDAFPGEEE